MVIKIIIIIIIIMIIEYIKEVAHNAIAHHLVIDAYYVPEQQFP